MVLAIVADCHHQLICSTPQVMKNLFPVVDGPLILSWANDFLALCKGQIVGITAEHNDPLRIVIAYLGNGKVSLTRSHENLMTCLLLNGAQDKFEKLWRKDKTLVEDFLCRSFSPMQCWSMIEIHAFVDQLSLCFSLLLSSNLFQFPFSPIKDPGKLIFTWNNAFNIINHTKCKLLCIRIQWLWCQKDLGAKAPYFPDNSEYHEAIHDY